MIDHGEFTQLNRFRLPVKLAQPVFTCFVKQKNQKKLFELSSVSQSVLRDFIGQVSAMHVLADKLSHQEKQQSSPSEEASSPRVESSESLEESLSLSEVQDKNIQKICKISQKHLQQANML